MRLTKYAIYIIAIVLVLSTPFTKINASNKTITYTHKQLWVDESNSKTLYSHHIDSIIKINQSLNSYSNIAYGYKFNYPSNWLVDRHLPSKYVRFYSDKFRLDFTVQNADDAWTTPDNFINQTIKYLKNKTELIELTKNNSEYKIFKIGYFRPRISHIAGDLNYYSYYFIVKNNYIYTFHLKTNKSNYSTMNSQVGKMINSINLNNPNNNLINYNIPTVKNSNINIVGTKYSLNIPNKSVAWGIYNHNAYSINNTEKMLGSQFGAQLLYYNLDSTYDPYINQLIKKGKIPIVTLQFLSKNKPGKPIIEDIVNGKYDNAIKIWATNLKGTSSPVFIRLANEMNGIWTLYSSKYTSNDPDIYKLAYRHVVNIFRANKANNVKFIWNPNVNSEPYYSWNYPELYYPGHSYVDWIGLTAYNMGKTSWGEFQSFSRLYDQLYKKNAYQYPNKPMIITEFASSEVGGDKAKFINDAFTQMPINYPMIKIAVWFNEEDAGYSFPLTSSEKSKQAFKDGLRSKVNYRSPIKINKNKK